MSKISRESAQKLSSIVLSKKLKEVEAIKETFQLLLESEYLKTVPKSIVELPESIKQWLKKSSSFQLIGNGFGYKYAHSKNRVPCTNDQGTIPFEPSAKVAEKLKSAMSKMESAEKNYKDVRLELIGTLLSLGTAKRIVEAFPELSQHIQQPVMSVSVDVTGIKKKINALP